MATKYTKVVIGVGTHQFERELRDDEKEGLVAQRVVGHYTKIWLGDKYVSDVRIGALFPEIGVVVLSLDEHDDPQYVFDMISAGGLWTERRF